MLKVVAVMAVAVAAAHGAGLEGYSIVRSEAIPRADAFVLEDVRGLLSRGLGGAEVPVCAPDAAPAAKRIFFGIESPGFDVASLANQEHVVVVRDGDVYLFGGGTNGTRYAAYDFLQGVLGYRFFDARGGVRVPDLRHAQGQDRARRGRGEHRPARGISILRHGQPCRHAGLLRQVRRFVLVPGEYFRGVCGRLVQQGASLRVAEVPGPCVLPGRQGRQESGLV